MSRNIPIWKLTAKSRCRTLYRCVSRNSQTVTNLSSAVVAPYIGAWVEILNSIPDYISQLVAPYIGAWVEMCIWHSLHMHRWVAPYIGAWVEICLFRCILGYYYCRTLYRCVSRNLAPCLYFFCSFVAPYIGAWVEIWYYINNNRGKQVAPYIGAWVEILQWIL